MMHDSESALFLTEKQSLRKKSNPYLFICLEQLYIHSTMMYKMMEHVSQSVLSVYEYQQGYFWKCCLKALISV